jgi:hypothetical protein
MTIYESNFIKLLNLSKKLRAVPTIAEPEMISSNAPDCDLYLKLLLREPYTTTVNLTYWFEDETVGLIADPNLTLRIYHDASLVEALSGRQEHRHPQLKVLSQAHSIELGRRWHNNIMLNKWLDYLIEMGHGFS